MTNVRVRSVLGFVAACLVTAVPVRAQQVASERAVPERTADVLARPVTVELNRVPLKRAVEAIATSAGVRISYQGQMVEPVTSVTLHASKLALGAALEAVLSGTDLYAVPVAPDLVSLKVVGARLIADGEITGKVVDDRTKRPVVGVTVTLEGTKRAARTGENGAFRLTGVAPGNYVLVARRLGYVVSRKSVTVEENVPLQVDMMLSPTATPLEEVVTTVTGPQRRLELGNVVSVINADSLVKEAPIMTISQLLSSRVPGLIAAQSQGTVGGDVTLKIRGLSSISLSTQPIVIVDGIRYSSNAVRGTADNRREAVSPLNDLNPNDVESVEVVKGPSAATLYGTDASNGVIVITTKRGKPGTTKWSAFATRLSNEIPRKTDANVKNVYHGWKTFDSGDVIDDCRLENLCIPDSITVAKSVLADDRYSILQKAPGSWTSGVSASGGQSVFRYFVSGTYDDQTAAVGIPDTVRKLILKSRGLSKLPDYMVRPNTQTLFNLRSNVTAALGTRGDVTISTGYTRGETRSIQTDFRPFTTMLQDGDDIDRNLLISSNEFQKSSTENNNRFVGSLNANGQIASWLTARGTVGLDMAMRNRHELAERDSTRYLDPTGSVFEGRTKQMAASADGGITLSIQRGWANFRTSAGTQYVRSLNDVITVRGSNLAPGAGSIVGAATTVSGQEYLETVTLGSYLEETIGLSERLYLTGAVRVDGASGFGSGYTAAAYPKVSGSWLLSQEPWIRRPSWVDEVRLRASLGASGRQAPPTYQLPGWGIGRPDAQYGIGQTLNFSSIGNADLRPEKGTEFETGFDMTLWRQRANIELTWANRRTKDLILNQLLLPGYGNIYRNIALATAHSFELRATTQLIDTRPFSLALTLQHSEQGTKLLKLGTARPDMSPGGGYAEGYPIGARFTRPLIGFDDANGDGIIVESELEYGDENTYAGPNAPPRTQQLTTNVGFFAQRLRFSALLDREAGGTMLLEMYCGRCREAYDRTTPLAEQALHVARWSNPAMSGTFTRLREITMALTIPQRVLRTFHVGSGTFSLSARNLALWTQYAGASGDPESSPITGLVLPYARETANGIPQSRTWVTRFDVGL